jgi:hypothetical protein
MANTFVASISDAPTLYAEESLRFSLFEEYKRVVMESLISSFGLDFLMGDRHGGDVDTINNVRQIGSDERMTYKNKNHEKNYNNRGEYNHSEYHKDDRFASKKHEAREKYQATGKGETDTYTGETLEHTTSSAVPKDRRAELDHVVETKAIHDDRGRVLAGLNGVDLANAHDNLAWTNKSLNASMGSWARHKNDHWREKYGCDAPIDEVDMKAYLREHPEIDAETQKRMIAQYEKSHAAYEKEVAKAYYTSRAFFKDTAKAAGKLGVKMGMKAVAGLIFAEVWFAVEDEFNKLVSFGKEMFYAIGRGIKKGFNKACQSYKVLIDKFLGSAVAGVLSSLFTTITNIFFTTAKSFVRIIRHTWASLVEAVKVLLFNPDCFPMGERIRSTAKIIATGASVVSGVMVTEALNKTAVGTIPFIGEIISTFCGTMVTGIMTCSLLFFLDHNSAINKLVEIINKIPSIDNYVAYVKMQAHVLDEYAAKLMNLDIETFRKETGLFVEASIMLDNIAEDDTTINGKLIAIYDMLRIELPWRGFTSFDEFMNDETAILTFK